MQHLFTLRVLSCLQTSLTKEVSLPGMMTAITEVEVSKEDKMRKIEETERIKHAMLLKKTGRWGFAGPDWSHTTPADDTMCGLGVSLHLLAVAVW